MRQSRKRSWKRHFPGFKGTGHSCLSIVQNPTFAPDTIKLVLQIGVYRSGKQIRTFLVSARKVPQRSRVKGRFGQMRPLYKPPPHRRPAFKNVPIFERLHSANLQVCSAEPAENRNIFSGRWSKAAGVGSGAGWCSAQRIKTGRLPVAIAP